MYTVIGLGSAGHKVVMSFLEYPQYNGYTVDCEMPEESRTIFMEIPEFDHPEEYEKGVPDLSKRFNNLGDTCLFVVCGASIVSGGSLRILEAIHKKSKVSVLYIKPDISVLSEMRKLQENLVYNVLQEYSRSGVLEDFYVVDNTLIDEMIGGAPILGYFEHINRAMVSTIHMINVFSHQKKIIGTFSDPDPSAKIATFGILNTETGEEKPFFEMDNIREKIYYYAIPEKELKTDKKLLSHIREQVKSKPQGENVKLSYGVFPTKYNERYAYFVTRSSNIQK